MRKIPPFVTDARLIFHRASSAWLRGKHALDSLFFPWNCPGCSRILPSPEVVCEPCAQSLPRIRAPHCRRCGAPFPVFWRVKVCPECRDRKSPLTALRSCYYYEGLVRKMVRDAKYRRSARILRYFAGELYLQARNEFPAGIQAVTPVPLHRRREWNRTYNQSELLARDLGRWWNIPVWKGLRRVEWTPPQSGLSGAARRRNLKHAFAVLDSRIPRSVLLIDDVVTTGATLEACARALRRAGIRRVYAVTIARAVKKKV